jgi:adenine-specific DNA-methyltransferase
MSKGQYFTKNNELKEKLYSLCKNTGNIFEPSAGRGDLVSYFEYKGDPINYAIELDDTIIEHDSIEVRNFFDVDTNIKFDTIVGNPPYVKQQDVENKEKINSSYNSLNLYQYFIEKSFYHLNDEGEIVFIIPREFLSNTRTANIKKMLYYNGTITHIIDYQERRMFDDADPYVVVMRYEKGNFSHKTYYEVNGETTIRNEVYQNGLLKYVSKIGEPLNKFFDIKVGIVSGANNIFENEYYGNIDVICSDFIRTGRKRRFIFDENNEYDEDTFNYLLKHKDRLISRSIRNFDEHNWFEWGAIRNIRDMKKEGKCIYVNNKTRYNRPFFVEDIDFFDGSILALIPKTKEIENDIYEWCDKLNNSYDEFFEQGYIVGNKYQFTQKSLSNFLIT